MEVFRFGRDGLRRFEKALLVCAGTCEEIERRLVSAGCKVTKVADGETAVDKIRRENFDALRNFFVEHEEFFILPDGYCDYCEFCYRR